MPSTGSGRGTRVHLRPSEDGFGGIPSGLDRPPRRSLHCPTLPKEGPFAPLFWSRYKLLAKYNLYRRPYGGKSKHTPRARRGGPGQGPRAVQAGGEWEAAENIRTRQAPHQEQDSCHGFGRPGRLIQRFNAPRLSPGMSPREGGTSPCPYGGRRSAVAGAGGSVLSHCET